MVANAHRGPKTRAFKIEDFMPAEPKGEQSPEQQAAILMLATAGTRAAFGEG